MEQIMTQKVRDAICRVIGGLWAISVTQDQMVSSACADMAEMLENMLNEDGKGE